MLTEKDICLTIATLNRPKELDKTLHGIQKTKNIPGKIYIIDQSKDKKTHLVFIKYKKKLPISYIHSKTASSSMAKNVGIKKSKDSSHSPKGPIACDAFFNFARSQSFVSTYSFLNLANMSGLIFLILK